MPSGAGVVGQELCFPGTAFSSLWGFFALRVTSGITGNFLMRWDNDDNSGKMLREIGFNECSYPGKQVLLQSCG